MAEIVNLRQARKRRDRAAKQAEAEANRRAHGRSKAERLSEDARREKLRKAVDDSKLDEGDEPAADQRPGPGED